MQCLRPLSQDERCQPATSEAPEATGECGRERALVRATNKGVASSYSPTVSGLLKDGLRMETHGTVDCSGLLVELWQLISSWSLKISRELSGPRHWLRKGTWLGSHSPPQHWQAAWYLTEQGISKPLAAWPRCVPESGSVLLRPPPPTHKPQSLWDPEGSVLPWDCVGGNSGWQPDHVLEASR